ncbi:hypothetical protein DPMN_039532 [Dreissena polymorpha]|uniref:Uncharacterized protein n=1 Tax=Dreissena polymorpha TaxID=45954 RepID=A0A9D4CV56_DREPO|nr:hypothetical protein DPMN_039532 [Dreissena polymorpha]
MATMMSHAAKEMFCMEDSGEKRMHGDKWSRDDCTVCRCKVGCALNPFMPIGLSHSSKMGHFISKFRDV